MEYRTDRNNNPTAFTTAIAEEAGLTLGTDYVQGDAFAVGVNPGPQVLYTARLLGDPIALTIRVIDTLTFYTKSGALRWSYIAMSPYLWKQLNPLDVIGTMYKREQGVAMRSLFPNYNLL